LLLTGAAVTGVVVYFLVLLLPVWVAVTGQTVVAMGITDVTTTVERAGQLVTVAAQLVMVYWVVL